MVKKTNGYQKKRKISENGARNGTNDDRESKKKKLRKELYKVPNVEEINQLQTVERSQGLNFFLLQIDELLKETKIKEKRINFITEYVNKLEKFLLNLKSDDEKKFVSDLKWPNNKDICVPLNANEVPFDLSDKCFFQFLKPESVFVCGAWKQSTVIDSHPTVSVCIEMPAKFFQKADHMNGIYHRKRALYLSYIALKLKQWNEVDNYLFSCLHDDPLQPVIVIKPNGAQGKHVTFKLRVVGTAEAFKLERFAPEKSNVKHLIDLNAKKGKKVSNVVSNDNHTPTPHYNSNILRDVTAKRNENFLYEILNENVNLRNAIILLKIWSRQRNFDKGYGRLPSHVLSMFVAQLVQSGRISTAMSSYQILRQVWVHLSSTSWNKSDQSITLYQGKRSSNEPSREEFHKYFDVVFVDSSGFYNLCANVSLDLYLRIKRESSIALNLLNDEQTNTFRILFGTKYPMYIQVDHIVQLTSNLRECIQKNVNKSNVFNFSGFWYPHVQKLLFDILRKGLGQRIHALVPIDHDAIPNWSIDQKCVLRETKLQFGLVLNSEYALDILNKGPQSNLPEAEEYRTFWGTKAELRRFRDGSICEACVWSATDSPLSDRRFICEKIVKHLLNHHFGFKEDDILYTGNELDIAYSIDKTYEESFDDVKNAEQLSTSVIKAFDDLAKMLRSLQNIPLSITSVLGKSPVFRYCEPYPPVPNARTFRFDDKEHFNAHLINEAVIQFETSAKWPNDLNAIKRVKAAFYLQMAKELRKKYQMKVKVNVDSIDILKDGFLFRFKIGVSREIALLKKEVSLKGITKYRDTPDSLQLEQESVLLPRVNVSLNTLYHQHSAFGPTVMIAKRWLYSQLLDSYSWPDDCTELLIAYQFSCDKIDNPAQPQTGFFRFLHLLSTANWKTDLILLNFNNELTKEYVEKLELDFVSHRDTFPPLTIITSSVESNSHTIWTKSKPTIEVLARVTLLARYAINLISSSIFNSFDAGSLFKASLEGYNLIINLDRMKIRDCLAHDFNRPLISFKKKKPFIPHADYDPVVSYLRELRSAYDHVAMFFHNPYGGQQIGILWKPVSFESSEFRVLAVNGQTLENEELKYDHEKLKNDFNFIGHELIERIISNENKN